jgi:hypothetical protein
VEHDSRDIGNAEDLVGELLDDDDREAVAGDVGNVLVELLDEDRGEAHRELVDEEHGRVGRERAGHREHLLLAARQRSGRLLAPVGEAREACERAFLHDRKRRAGERGHPQVLEHREVGEDPPTFGNEAHARARERVGGSAVHDSTEQREGSGGWRDLAAGNGERRRLPGAVRPEQRVDLRRHEPQVDAVQHVDAAVAGADLRQLEHRLCSD